MKSKYNDTYSIDTGSKLESMTSEQRIESLNYILYMIAGLIILVFLIGITLHIKRQNRKYTRKRPAPYTGPKYKQMSLVTTDADGDAKEYVYRKGGADSRVQKRRRSLTKSDKRNEVLGPRRNSRAIIHPLH